MTLTSFGNKGKFYELQYLIQTSGFRFLVSFHIGLGRFEMLGVYQFLYCAFKIVISFFRLMIQRNTTLIRFGNKGKFFELQHLI